MRLINGDALYRKVKRECNPYGKPTIDFESGNRVLDLIDSQPTIQPEPHWIPVTERLPEIGESVLMRDIDGDIYLGHRTQCGYYYPDFCGDRVKNVTAWCNLPEPYKGVTT